MGLLIFFGVCAFLALLHLFVWRRWIRPARLARPWRRVAGALLVAGSLLLPATALLLGIFGRHGVGAWFYTPMFWLVPFSYVVLLLAVAEAVRFVARRIGRRAKAVQEGVVASTAPEATDRRVALARLLTGASVAGAAVISAGGARAALGDVETPEVPVRLSRLPRALDGYRIALITDVHVSPLLGERYVADLVARVGPLKPDLVAIVGDLVDEPVARARADVSPLSALQARDGVHFVTGNHEYYTGDTQGWLEHLRKLGFRVLTNERLEIGDRGGSFDLVGVPDWSRRGRGDGPDLRRTLEGRDPERELVLLAHQPKQIYEATELGVGLQLSGHTHGGQVWPLGTLLAHLGNPYVHGLHRHGEATQIYVSRGAGYWGIPMRVLQPPEVAVLVLTT